MPDPMQQDDQQQLLARQPKMSLMAAMAAAQGAEPGSEGTSEVQAPAQAPSGTPPNQKPPSNERPDPEVHKRPAAVGTDEPWGEHIGAELHQAEQPIPPMSLKQKILRTAVPTLLGAGIGGLAAGPVGAGIGGARGLSSGLEGLTNQRRYQEGMQEKNVSSLREAMGKYEQGQTQQQTELMRERMNEANRDAEINMQLNKPVALRPGGELVDPHSSRVLASVPGTQPKQDDFEQAYGQYLKDNRLPDTSMNRLQFRGQWSAAGQTPQRPQQPQRQLAVTPDGKVIEVQPGMMLPQGTVSLSGQMGGTAKAEAQQVPEAADVDYANTYLTGGRHTGPGDEALMERFFDLVKPSSGFRMSQPQIDLLMQSRSAMQGLAARAKHMFTPEAPWFSDQQRQQIVSTMQDIYNSKVGAANNRGGSNSRVLGAAPAGAKEGRTGTYRGTPFVIHNGQMVAR